MRDGDVCIASDRGLHGGMAMREMRANVADPMGVVMDERVEIMAAAMWEPDDPIAVEIAESVLAALEAAGYTIAKLDEEVCGTCRGEFWHAVRKCPACNGQKLYSIDAFLARGED